MGRDLGALLQDLLRVVVDEETPILAARGLQMWDYVVLVGLAEGAAPTQAQLATTVRRDKTRIIPILDRLQEGGLVDRTPDPADRRNRVVTLTPAGRERLAECRAAIAAMEDGLLARLEPAERTVLRGALERLAS